MPQPARSGNQLLDRLAPDEAGSFVEGMRREPLKAKASLYEAGEDVSRVYFPIRGVISFMVPLADGAEIEAATIGNEGMAGLDAFVGTRMMGNSRVVGQIDGEMLSADAESFLDAVGRSEPFRRLLLRYSGGLIAHVAQSVACNGRHVVVERCARWLLEAHDRAGRDEFGLTHEYLASMLAVRRASVTIAANTLQQAGLIRYRRGKVTILDREQLEQAACECYQEIRDNYERVMAEPA